MSRLPNLKPRKIIKALKKAGFIEINQVGSHRTFWHPIRKLKTGVPIHSKDTNRSLMKEIIQQAGLTEEEFLLHVPVR